MVQLCRLYIYDGSALDKPTTKGKPAMRPGEVHARARTTALCRVRRASLPACTVAKASSGPSVCSSLREHARPCSSDWCWPVVQSSCPVVDDWTTGQHQSQQAAPKSGPPTGLYFFPTVFEGASAYLSICRDGADGADHRHRRRRGPNQGHDAAGHRSRAARDWQRLQNRPDGPR